MDFRAVEENLRQSFRVLAAGRPGTDVAELPGVTIASLGAQFQMFNAAFLSAPVESAEELGGRLETARAHFAGRGTEWSFWICEDWLAAPARRKLTRCCLHAGLRLSSELPGMMASRICLPQRRLPELEFRRAVAGQEIEDFRDIGANCFHVPLGWFCEVFDDDMTARADFVCWAGYLDGEPVATAATVITPGGVIGVYNVATSPVHRRRGYGEAITRYAIDAARNGNGAGERVILQSTTQGYQLYRRLGFGEVTRILVYNSVPVCTGVGGKQA
jgi:ribosomal protein S18 acetylase RimI-like enzyme